MDSMLGSAMSNSVMPSDDAELDMSVTVSSANTGAEPTSSILRSKGIARGAGRKKTMVASRPSLGTEFGKKETHRVQSTTFERASVTPEVEVMIRYGDRDELKKMGILEKPVVAREPAAFPGDKNCAPPAGWDGR